MTGGRKALTAHLWVWAGEEWVRVVSGGPGEMRRNSNAVRATLRALDVDVAVQVSEWPPTAPPEQATAGGDVEREWAVRWPPIGEIEECRDRDQAEHFVAHYSAEAPGVVVTRTVTRSPWRAAT